MRIQNPGFKSQDQDFISLYWDLNTLTKNFNSSDMLPVIIVQVSDYIALISFLLFSSRIRILNHLDLDYIVTTDNCVYII